MLHAAMRKSDLRCITIVSHIYSAGSACYIYLYIIIITVLRRTRFLGVSLFRNTGSRPVASSAAGWRVNAGESGRMRAEAYDRSADVCMHAAKHPHGITPPAGWAGRPLRSFAPLSVRMYMLSSERESAVTNRIGGRLHRMHGLS